jgi:hypothetical protein
MTAYEIAIGKDLIDSFCEALGEDSKFVQRIIIDVSYDTIATIHVQKIADKKIFEILPAIARGAAVVMKDRQE